jgi:hypothetical protein
MSKKDTKINESAANATIRASIAAFINAISSKKYALAHKYLTGVVNEKIKSRINSAASKPLF